jgi:hypothetical protein
MITWLDNPNLVPLLQQWLASLQAIDKYVSAVEWEQKYQLDIPALGTQVVVIPKLPWNYIRFNHGAANNFASYITLTFSGQVSNSNTPDLEALGTVNPNVLILPDQYQQIITITNARNAAVAPQETVIGNIVFGFVRRNYAIPYEPFTDS